METFTFLRNFSALECCWLFAEKKLSSGFLRKTIQTNGFRLGFKEILNFIAPLAVLSQDVSWRKKLDEGGDNFFLYRKAQAWINLWTRIGTFGLLVDLLRIDWSYMYAECQTVRPRPGAGVFCQNTIIKRSYKLFSGPVIVMWPLNPPSQVL